MKTNLKLLSLLVWLVSASSIHPEDCPAHCKCDTTRRMVNCSSSDIVARHLKQSPADTEILILDNSNISSIYNDSLSTLRRLKKFSAQNCMIVHIDKGSFSNMNELKEIELGRNMLYDFTLLHKLPSLSYLNLTRNRIKYYNNISVCQMPLLETMDLSVNFIKTSMLTKDFSCLRNLSTFLLDSNQLTEVADDDFAPLANSPLKKLSMQSCALQVISTGAFLPIKSITSLNLNWNHLGINLTAFENSMQALCSPSSLEHLDLSYNKITKYTAQSFKCLRNLKYLTLYHNGIMDLPANGFEGLISLEDLHLSKNKIRTISETALKGMIGLKTLTFELNDLMDIPMNIFASKTNDSEAYMPNISMINFSSNKIKLLQKNIFKGLSNLRKLYLNNNAIKTLSDDVFEGLLSLMHLSINNNRLGSIHNTAFRPLNKTLVYLSLQANGFGKKFPKMSSSRFGYGFLKHIPELTDLLLNRNEIRDSYHRLNTLIPTEMRKSLRRLSLRNMIGIRALPGGTFARMYNLQILDISDNDIAFWDFKTFTNLPSLIHLELRNNHIRILNESSLGSVWYQLTHFSADHNQYACVCDLLWFLNWIKNATKHNVTIPISHSAPYKCAFPKNMATKYIFEYRPTNLECIVWWVIFTPSMAGCLFLLVVSATLYGRYRYHLRLCCFRNFGIGYKDYEAVDGEEHEYDAFISYSQEDMEWVIQILVKKMEGQYGFKVFFEDRDYVLGGTMMDNIIAGIESSRRVIIVLSQSFLQGQWCGLEVQLIQKKLLKKLIVIKREDIRDFELSPTLGWILRERRYIEWIEHPAAQELFWEKLKHAVENNPDKPRLFAL